MQAIFSIFIFVLLSSQDGFDTHTHIDIHGRTIKPALYNGIFSTIAFLVGAISSVASGFIGMKIATYANARTALEARKGIAPAFAVGEHNLLKYTSAYVITVKQYGSRSKALSSPNQPVAMSTIMRLFATQPLLLICWWGKALSILRKQHCCLCGHHEEGVLVILQVSWAFTFSVSEDHSKVSCLLLDLHTLCCLFCISMACWEAFWPVVKMLWNRMSHC